MIHYTLNGPTYELEIHDHEIRLVKKRWLKVFSRKQQVNAWKISDLSHFEVAVPKFMMISGKLQWTTFHGEKGSFRFSTNPIMVKKIETYLQKRVIKNHQTLNASPKVAQKIQEAEVVKMPEKSVAEQPKKKKKKKAA